MMAVAALVCFATMGFAQAKSESKAPFTADFDKLSAYLELSDYQMNDVYEINVHFIDAQQQSVDRNPNVQEKRMKKALYGNLKLMKKELTAEQYRKYVALLNITNFNNGLIGGNDISDVYLAKE